MNRLAAHSVSFGFGELRVVDRVDLVAEPTQVTALIGPNGAGKTTLLSCLSGTAQLKKGRVLLGDKDVTRLPGDARARLGLQRTFQNPEVFLSLTVEENLMVAAENRSSGGLLRGLLGLPDPGRASAAERAAEAMDELRLDEVRAQRTATLPTGTLRLVELARALAAEPAVLLLDEPAAGLSDVETARLAAVLRRVANRGVAVLLVEHDLQLVFDVADRVHVMAAGRIIAVGTPHEVRTNPVVQAALELQAR
jgi:branched-chain amino acid transport system ATP-binding protein